MPTRWTSSPSSTPTTPETATPTSTCGWPSRARSPSAAPSSSSGSNGSAATSTTSAPRSSGRLLTGDIDPRRPPSRCAGVVLDAQRHAHRSHRASRTARRRRRRPAADPGQVPVGVRAAGRVARPSRDRPRRRLPRRRPRPHAATTPGDRVRAQRRRRRRVGARQARTIAAGARRSDRRCSTKIEDQWGLAICKVLQARTLFDLRDPARRRSRPRASTMPRRAGDLPRARHRSHPDRPARDRRRRRPRRGVRGRQRRSISRSRSATRRASSRRCTCSAKPNRLRGDTDAARDHHRRALTLASRIGHAAAMCEAMEDLARTEAVDAARCSAATLLRAARAERDASGPPAAPTRRRGARRRSRRTLPAPSGISTDDRPFTDPRGGADDDDRPVDRHPRPRRGRLRRSSPIPCGWPSGAPSASGAAGSAAPPSRADRRTLPRDEPQRPAPMEHHIHHRGDASRRAVRLGGHLLRTARRPLGVPASSRTATVSGWSNRCEDRRGRSAAGGLAVHHRVTGPAKRNADTMEATLPGDQGRRRGHQVASGP